MPAKPTTPRKLPSTEKLLETPEFEAVLAGILSCKTKAELKDFLRDIATLSELKAFAERLAAAHMISEGLSYREIAHRTGASTTTITRVAQWLNNGRGGYTKVLNKIQRMF